MQVSMNRSTLMQAEVPISTTDLANRPYPPSLISLHRQLVIDHTAAVPAAPEHHSEQQMQTHECLMLITISADSISEFRHLVMCTCGACLVFIRTQPVARVNKMKVWLCLSNPASELVMDAVMRTLPSAEFGKITYA